MSNSFGNVLLLSAGRRVSLLRGFLDACDDENINVFAADMFPKISSACNIADNSFKLPHVLSDQYHDSLYELCITQNIKLVIPTIDTELPVLAKLREEFLKSDIEILVCDLDLINFCNDKRLTAEFFIEKNLSTPKLFSKENLVYPILVKPFDGSLSKGVELLQNSSELTLAILENPKNIYCEYIDHDKNDEFTIDVYYNRFGRMKCIVPRQRVEVRGGEVSKGLTVRNSIIKLLQQSLSELKGARGCLTFQAFVNRQTQDVKFIEINPRFGGGYPLTRLADADYQAWLVREYLLGQDIDYFEAWRENTLMLRYDAEIIVANYE